MHKDAKKERKNKPRIVNSKRSGINNNNLGGRTPETSLEMVKSRRKHRKGKNKNLASREN